MIKYLRKTTIHWVNRIIMILGSSDPAQKKASKIAVSVHMW